VSVFNYVDKHGQRGPNYRDLFPTPPPPGLVPSCAEGGVIGLLPGIVGSLQANEVIKVVTGIGDTLSGRLFLIDALTFETRTLKLHKDPATPQVTELIDYEQFCGIGPEDDDVPKVKEVTVDELYAWQEAGRHDYQVIDVREPYEYEISNIGGTLIPLAEVEKGIDKIASDRKVVVHCRSGKRSAQAIEKLQKKYGFENLYNLKGGILAWADQIDADMAKY
jgi:adenylyltransferase/sulfurtransferase